MAWPATLVDRLRYLINDLDTSNYTWTDLQLAKFIVIAAIDVFAYFSPDWNAVILGPYNVDTTIPSIAPDPTTNGAPQGVANMIVLKAACLITSSEFKKLGLTAGWKVVDDRSVIDGAGALLSSKQVRDSFCQGFIEARDAFQGGNYSAGSAILSPYSSFNYKLGGGNSWPYYPPRI